jgi:hypothetical protein
MYTPNKLSHREVRSFPRMSHGRARRVEKVAASEERLICSDEAGEIGNELKGSARGDGYGRATL